MSETTSIGWTDATFNPWWGCVEVSRECDNCYARVWARRTGAAVWGKHSPRRPASESYWRLPFTKLRRKADELGRPCRVFCASMADVFETHPDLPPLRERLWDVIERTPWIDWQLLTKRPRSVQLMAPWGDDWPPNVWIGTSIGAPEHTWRADVLREIPAAVRFISAEPLLGSLYPSLKDPNQGRAVDSSHPMGETGAPALAVRAATAHQVARSDDEGSPARANDPATTVGRRSRSSAPLDLTGIDWVIIGGESGPGARPFHLEHAREIIRAAKRPECCGRWATVCCGCYLPTGECCGEGEQACCYEPDVVGPAVFVKQLGAKPVYIDDLTIGVYAQKPLQLRHSKGEDMDEWPADLRIREFPVSRPREGEAMPSTERAET